MECPRCKERGKTWEGGDPVCAFNEVVFSSENWNCATMNDLRELLDDDYTYNEDDYAGIIPFTDLQNELVWHGFLVLNWYKRRGRTDGAYVLSGEERYALCYDLADEILRKSK